MFARNILLILLFVLILLSFYLFRGDINLNNSFQKNIDKTDALAILPSPSPIPFEELTIPFLRKRNYQSKLGSLEIYQQYITYTAYLTNYNSDGLRINGLLTIPKGERPAPGWPAIVFVHGYIPPNSYKTTQNYESYVENLAKNGFVVFKIDLRGHDKSEGESTGAYYSPDYVIDVLNAYAALQGADFVNPKAIGFWGHSMAGNVVFRAWAVRLDVPAVVIWAGAVYSYEDFAKFRLNDNSYHPPLQSTNRQRKRQELFDTYGEFDNKSSFWQAVAATNYVTDLKGAIEMHHAIDDTVVNIGYSKNLMDILDRTKIVHKLYEYPSGGHNLMGVSFNQAMERSVFFFKDYLR